MKNKIKFGLKNTHYAVISESDGKVTYGDLKPIPGAVNLSLAPRGERTEFYADDRVYFGTTANQGYQGTLEIALIPDEFRVDVLGDEVDSNGALIENANAIPKNIALLFEFSGDKKQSRHVSYNVEVARPNIEGETKSQTITPKTETLNITANPSPETGDVKAKVSQGQVGYDTFFNSVYLKNQAKNTVANNEITVKKSEIGNVVLDITSTAVENTIKSVKLNGVPITHLNLTIDEIKVTILTAALTDLPVGKHTIEVGLAKGNVVVVSYEITENGA